MLATELQDHLGRLVVFAAISVALGLVMLFRRGNGLFHGFGLMSIAWGVINAVIAWLGRGGVEEAKLAPTREFLALNLGLNVTYVAVGVTLALLTRERARGAGLAVAVQGLGLLALDGYLLSRLPPVG